MLELLKMSELTGERKVYSEFLTNLAVAWFSAGIIAPLFNPAPGLSKFSASLVAVVTSLISLKLAVLFIKEEK